METTASDITRVRQIGFAELYLGHPALGDRMSDGRSASIEPLPRNEALLHDLEQLKSVCRQARRYAPSSSEFKVVYDDVAYRVFLIEALRGEVMVLRKVADAVGALADLGIAQGCIARMLVRDLAGLFLVSGAAKSGKTTTASTLVKERLCLHGGIAVTAEDPTELPLEGKHGDGICYQTRTSRECGGFADAFRPIARWGPDIIFIGEIRDRETAVQALQASVTGRLVISTIQADSLLKAVMKLHSLANEKMVSGGAQLLSDGLAGVLHQRLLGAAKPRPTTEFLWLKDAPAARRQILEGSYELLAAEIERQSATLFGTTPPPRRQP